EGRKRAKERGVKFGRPAKLTAHQRREAMQRLADGAVQADLARSYGVSQATISRLAAPSPFEASAAGAVQCRATATSAAAPIWGEKKAAALWAGGGLGWGNTRNIPGKDPRLPKGQGGGGGRRVKSPPFRSF